MEKISRPVHTTGGRDVRLKCHFHKQNNLFSQHLNLGIRKGI